MRGPPVHDLCSQQLPQYSPCAFPTHVALQAPHSPWDSKGEAGGGKGKQGEAEEGKGRKGKAGGSRGEERGGQELNT